MAMIIGRWVVGLAVEKIEMNQCESISSTGKMATNFCPAVCKGGTLIGLRWNISESSHQYVP